MPTPLLRTALAALATAACFGPAMAAPPGVIAPAGPGIPAGSVQVQTAAFYKAWKQRYIAQTCGKGRYLVDVAADGKPVGGGTEAGTLTVSEAHGYGMLLTVIMADADPQARTIFDGMVQYFHDHQATDSPGLMAWNQLRDCSNAAKVNGGASATDGDLDIAYALLLADRRWGSKGAVNYAAEARRVMAAVLKYEVSGDVLLIGDWAKDSDEADYAHTTRASDFMVSHFKAFADASGDKRWLAVRDRIYATIATVRASASRKTALMPDFIIGLPKKPVPAPAGYLEGEHDGDYSWNSGRYPWRIAMDYILNGEPRAKAALDPLNAWARQATAGKPARFADTYRLDGTPAKGSGRNSMAFVPMLGVAATTDAANQPWLNAIWADVTAVPLKDEDYFGNTLKLLGMTVMSGDWQRAAELRRKL